MKKIWLLGIVGLLVAILPACIRDKEEPDDDPDTLRVKIGDQLPAFSVKTIDGVTISNKSFEGKKGTIIFFNSTCKDCRRELPVMEQEYKLLMSSADSDDYLWICISREEGVANVTKYWEGEGFTMPVSAQSDRLTYTKFATAGIPLVIRTDGTTITAIDHSE